MLKSNIVKYAIMFILLILIQVLVLNKISFLGYGVPFIYMYFIIKLPIAFNRNLTILLGFLLGFIVDIFCNTPGINAAATTFVAFINKPMQSLFFMPDDFEEQTPSLFLLRGAFVKYFFMMTLVHHVILISLESFSYFNLEMMLLRILLSTLLTTVLIFALEGFSLNKKDTWQKSL